MKKTKEKEHYLKEIYKLEIDNKPISVSGLSNLLLVSKSSVSNMIKKLVNMNLLNSAPIQAYRVYRTGKRTSTYGCS